MSSPLFFVIHDMRLLNLFLSGNLIIVPSTRSEFCYEKLSKISLNLSKWDASKKATPSLLFTILHKYYGSITNRSTGESSQSNKYGSIKLTNAFHTTWDKCTRDKVRYGYCTSNNVCVKYIIMGLYINTLLWV